MAACTPGDLQSQHSYSAAPNPGGSGYGRMWMLLRNNLDLKYRQQRIKKSGAGRLFPTPDFSISILVSFPENWGDFYIFTRTVPIIYSTVTGWNNITNATSKK